MVNLKKGIDDFKVVDNAKNGGFNFEMKSFKHLHAVCVMLFFFCLVGIRPW